MRGYRDGTVYNAFIDKLLTAFSGESQMPLVSKNDVTFEAKSSQQPEITTAPQTPEPSPPCRRSGFSLARCSLPDGNVTTMADTPGGCCIFGQKEVQMPGLRWLCCAAKKNFSRKSRGVAGKAKANFLLG